LLLSSQVLLDLFLVFEVERDRPVNADERTGHGKGPENFVRRFAVLECMNNAVERNAGTGDLVAAFTLLDVVLHVPELQALVYAAWTPGAIFQVFGPIDLSRVAAHRR
jgi:hypothetical protein